ncbi:MAG TPA: M1 family aminopeptidase [Burkholderiales bacterium]|nr:M1 family aminopeptidase [Burkholderiales bacterium]
MSALARALCACVLLAAAALASAADLALTVDLDPSTRRFAATAELISPGPFAFTLHPSLNVEGIGIDGRRGAAARGSRGEWRIDAPKGSKLRIAYGGTLPALESLDHRAVLQNATPMASPKGSFLPGGSGWYPDPGRAFSYSVRLTLPHDQRGVVAGSLIAEHRTSDRYTAAFSFPHPAEGIDLMTGPYSVRERLVQRAGAPPLRLRTYFYPDLDALADGYLDDTARYIALYSDAIGPYPFDGFSIVASPLPTGFGMSTLTYLGAQVLKLPFIRGTSLGHEVLHNWWGNGVRVDYAQGNWSEGLTTFMADYFYKERDSDKAAREMRLSWLRDFAAVPDGRHLALAEFRSRTHGAAAAAGYGKSAMVFLMVRDAIGEEAFGRALRAFYAEHKFRAAGWDDLRAAFERASGRRLVPFFDQWLERRGGPDIAIAEARGRSQTLTLTFTQSAPAYALDVPVEIEGLGRRETRRIHIERARQDVQVDLPFVPERVRLDPELRVWRRLDASELSPILRQWIIARAPRIAIVSNDGGNAARGVAEAFFENRPQVVTLDAAKSSREPLLIAGLHADVDAALARLGLPPRPRELAGRGTAAAWTIHAAAAPIAVLSAQNVEALAATARALPHLGAQSYLVFEGARVIDRGIWPAPGRVVHVVRTPQ